MKRPTKKQIARQEATIAQLLNTALHHLGEINVPFVLKLEGSDALFSNVPIRHAIALLEDAATMTATLREKGIQAKVERIIENSQWGDDGKASA